MAKVKENSYYKSFKFEDIRQGKLFKYSGHYYIKCNQRHAINISSGVSTPFEEEDDVEYSSSLQATISN